jgi:peptidoglycan/LPS O-acetylase OafA/YrhL
VDLFFPLGFVIAHNYDRRIASGMTTSEFMTQRIIRLYPCYALALVVGFVLGSARLARVPTLEHARGDASSARYRTLSTWFTTR